MERHDQLKAECLELRLQLEAAKDDLAKAKADYSELQASYTNLKTGRVLEGIDVHDVDGTRERLAKLVREVDHCIALFNA